MPKATKVKFTPNRNNRTPEDQLYETVCSDERLQHHYFWDPLGDFVFTASKAPETTIFFRVRSEVFFGRSMPLTKIACEGRGRVWRLKGEIEDWENVLGLFTNNVYASTTPTLREALSALKLAAYYQMPVVRTWAESHLRNDFFTTPDAVRAAVDESHAFPGPLRSYSAVFELPPRMELDPRITALAHYAALLHGADADASFALRHPRHADALRAARGRLAELWTWTLKELAAIPGAAVHADGAAPCAATLEDWVGEDDPEDVLGTLNGMLNHPPDTCCTQCQKAAAEIVASAHDAAWIHLPHYFNLWVPDLKQGWTLPTAASQFHSNKCQTL